MIELRAPELQAQLQMVTSGHELPSLYQAQGVVGLQASCEEVIARSRGDRQTLEEAGLSALLFCKQQRQRMPREDRSEQLRVIQLPRQSERLRCGGNCCWPPL